MTTTNGRSSSEPRDPRTTTDHGAAHDATPSPSSDGSDPTPLPDGDDDLIRERPSPPLTAAERRVLEELVEPRRVSRLRGVVDRRITRLTLVLEDLYDSHNASAILRTAEGFGLLDVHVVERHLPFEKNRKVSIGADKWLHMHHYDHPEACVHALHEAGYKVVTTDLEATRTIDELRLDGPTALVMGNEHRGVSDEMRALSDEIFAIPMRGLSQSFNVSVASALVLYHFVRLETSSEGDLDTEARRLLFDEYLLKASPHAGKVLREAHLRRARQP